MSVKPDILNDGFVQKVRQLTSPDDKRITDQYGKPYPPAEQPWMQRIRSAFGEEAPAQIDLISQMSPEKRETIAEMAISMAEKERARASTPGNSMAL